MARASTSYWIGPIFMAIGLFIVVAVRLDPSGARAPLFVIDAAAGAFFFSGLTVLLQSLGARLPARLSVLLVIYLMAVPGLWMLLDANAGGCSASVAFGGLGTRGSADPAMCRAVFGIGGLLILAIALAMTWDVARRLWRGRGSGPTP